MESNVSKEWLEIFQTPDDRRDFPVRIEETVLYVNKHALAGFSPVFEKAIFGEFKEAKENELKLPGKSLTEVVELFSCMFAIPNHAKNEVSLKNVVTIWKLADEYLIEV